MVKSLSNLESKLLMQLSWDKKKVARLADIVRILKCSREYAYKIASVLCDKEWFERIGRGKYLLIPLEGGPGRVPDMNPYLAGRLLTGPYYFSYATANNYHGFSTQMYNTMFIVVLTQRRPFEFKNAYMKFITISKRKFFGFEKVKVMSEEVFMAEKEKTIIDSIDKPHYAGGIPEILQVLDKAKIKIDLGKVIDYAIRMHTAPLLQRLGFLFEFVKIKLPSKLEIKLIKKLGKNNVLLGNGKQWSSKGKIDNKWRVIQNIPFNILQESLKGVV